MHKILEELVESFIRFESNWHSIYRYEFYCEPNKTIYICPDSDKFEISEVSTDNEIVIFIDIPTNEEPEFHQWLKLLNA